MRKHFSIFLAVLAAVAATVVRPAELAAQQLSMIRDTEIENTIRAFATPIFLAAGLDPSAVRIYLVKDKQINAFVAGGQNLFINTGLLMRSQHAGQEIGVIAHEVGHISGGHLARTHDAIANSTAEAILALVLGAAAAAAGRPDVGGAVIAGGQNVALRNFLTYTRTQEGAADGAAMRYLDATQQSARGLLEFFDTLGDQELLSPARQDPYLRTHPLTRDRISAMEQFVSKSPNSDTPVKPDFEAMHRRMVAKLYGFLESPAVTRRRYKETDTSLEARYARAISYYKERDLEKALPMIDALIAEYPGDPYFYEFKGQALFENGRPAEALPAYQKAVEILPEAPLLRLDLARTQLALNDPNLLDPAIDNLRASLHREPNRPFVWRQLAIAYGRKGEMGDSSLALAEEAMLLDKTPDAKFHAEKAQRLLPPGSPGWIQAQDILQQAEQKKKD